jgi:hypothetical protein
MYLEVGSDFSCFFMACWIFSEQSCHHSPYYALYTRGIFVTVKPDDTCINHWALKRYCQPNGNMFHFTDENFATNLEESD